MGIENRSSKMKFKIGILKVEIENWNWNLKLNVDIEDSKMKFKKEIEYWNCEEFKKLFENSWRGGGSTHNRIHLIDQLVNDALSQ